MDLSNRSCRCGEAGSCGKSGLADKKEGIGRAARIVRRLACDGGDMTRRVTAPLLATLPGSGLLLARPAWAQTQGGNSLDQVLTWQSIVGLGGALALALLLIGLYILLRRRGTRQAHARIFGAMATPHQVVDSRGKSRFVNEAFEQRFGRGREPLPVLLGAYGMASEDRARLGLLVRNVQSGIGGDLVIALSEAPSEPRLGEEPAPEPEAQSWVRVAATPLEGTGGLVLWSCDPLRLDEAVESGSEGEQARFGALLAQAPIGAFCIDEQGRFTLVNETLAGWLGRSAAAMVSERLGLHDILERKPADSEPWDAFGAGGKTLAGPLQLKSVDGQILEVHLTQEIRRDKSGAVRDGAGVVRNLAAERAVADGLGRVEGRLLGFFQEAPVGIALVDGEGKITECNQALAALAEKEESAITGVGLLELVADEDHPAVESALAAARAATATPGETEKPEPPIEVHLAGEGEQSAMLHVAAVGEEGEAAAGYVVHLLDTTERRALEMQFSQSQKMQAVGQLAGGIAHDFNNLLTAMIGFSDLLLLRHRPGDQSFADVMQIKQNANRAANLVRQLLAFSRQQTLRPRVLDVTDILAELSHLLRRLIGENIELQISHGRDLGKVKADQGQLEQVIINLAVNARDAMPEGGKLAVRTGNVEVKRAIKQRGEIMPEGFYSCIEVTDSGHGIDPGHIDRIFEPFFSTKEVGAGTGLGLSTVYGIVKQSGGFVFVKSEMGTGTTFSIYLPHHEPSAEELAAGQQVPEESRDLSGIGTVLLVEDEDGVRAFSARALRNKGYEVLEARSGEAALEMLSEAAKPIDLLITDVVMPKVDGPTLVRQVRDQRPDLKVIFISGYAEDAFRQRLDQDAGIHFLPKPFSLKQLAGKVKEVMRDNAA